MNLKRLGVAFVATCFVLPPVLAADEQAQVAKLPPYEKNPGWTGFYLGAAFGAGAMVDRVNIPGGLAVGIDGMGGGGVLGSIYGGVDYQVLPRAVIGVLAEGTWSGFQASASAQVPGASANASMRADFGWAVLGRAGVLANPSTLLYFVGGYAGQNLQTGWDGRGRWRRGQLLAHRDAARLDRRHWTSKQC